MNQKNGVCFIKQDAVINHAHSKSRVRLVGQNAVPGDANAQQGVRILQVGDNLTVLDAVA